MRTSVLISTAPRRRRRAGRRSRRPRSPPAVSTARVSAPAVHRRSRFIRRGGAEAGRRGVLLDAVQGDEGAAGHVVGMRARLARRQHRRDAGIGALQQRAPLVAGPRAEDRGQLGLQAGPLGARGGIGAEPVRPEAGGIQSGAPDEVLVEPAARGPRRPGTCRRGSRRSRRSGRRRPGSECRSARRRGRRRGSRGTSPSAR